MVLLLVRRGRVRVGPVREAARDGAQAPREGRRDVAVDEDPLHAGARHAGVLIPRPRDALRGALEVCVGEDDGAATHAELQREWGDRLNAVPMHRVDMGPHGLHRDAPGQKETRDALARQDGGDRRPGADDVRKQVPRRERRGGDGVVDPRADGDHLQREVQDDGVAGEEGGGKLHERHRERVLPRRGEQADDAERGVDRRRRPLAQAPEPMERGFGRGLQHAPCVRR
mmetsp:Transcript_36864/g.113826  ORF Transcript_36864/g.113826 Transcript_36864/m.113826 type:complete len:228 (-) Transcript_36864:265-948(-)